MADGKSTLSKALLRTASFVLLAIAGLSFFWGGRALSEFMHVNRLLAEVEGLGVAIVSGFLGMLLKAGAE